MKHYHLTRALAGLAIATVAIPAHAEMHALLMGVGDYPIVQNSDGEDVDNRLFGPVNDMRAAERYALNTAKVPAANIITLRDKQATANGVLEALRKAASKLKEGDTFFWFFSGHGGQFKNTSESDGFDEGLILHDYSILLDDTVNGLCTAFNDAGINVVFVSDSCFSGGMDRAFDQILFRGVTRRAIPRWLDAMVLPTRAKGRIDRKLVTEKVLQRSGNRRLMSASRTKRASSASSLFLFSSQENQTSIDLGAAGGQEARGLFALLLFEQLKQTPEASVKTVMNSIEAVIRSNKLQDRQLPMWKSLGGAPQDQPFLRR